MSAIGAEALLCAARGWHVFPVNPKTKKPLTQHGLNDATLDVGTIEQWWKRFPKAMIGVRTGPQSGIFVVDLDCDSDSGLDGIAAFRELQNGGTLPETITVQTPRGGEHLWFRWVDGITNSTSKLAPGVDVRGAGGYVIVPPSRRSDGAEYSFLVDQDAPADAPPWLLNLLVPKVKTERRKTNGATGEADDNYARAALERECATVASAQPRSRNHTLNRAAFNLGQLIASGLLIRSEAETRLFSAAKSCGLVKDDGRKQVLATITSGVDAGMAKPRERKARANTKARTQEAPHHAEKDEDPRPDSTATPAPHPPRSLAEVHAVFEKWFGTLFDMATLDAVLAVTAAARLGGDAAWLLVISGSGNAKTETVSSVGTLPDAHIVSTIASQGALLSATSKKSRAKGATGGLLRKIGDRGVLIIKDFTSLLSIDHRARLPIMAALREIHDGRWDRNVGADGGQTLTWTGHVVVVGACTTAWDQAHSIVATMGDRFVLIRSDSRANRVQAGQQAIKNTGCEEIMRKEMAAAVAGLITNMTPPRPRELVLTDDEEERILRAANIVTFARTGVETDYRGDVIDAHAPEMPTRFARQLTQIWRGGIAIGMARKHALALALRCARDSIPQLRLAVLMDLKDHGESSVREVRRRLQKPWRTVNRALEALHALDLILCREEDLPEDDRKAGKPYQFYELTMDTDIGLDALNRGP
jgi:Bifunctional DNA primase/polymerase, N-terminal